MLIPDENTLVPIEKAFEESKTKRFEAKSDFKYAVGKYHTQLIARRSAGENLTAADIKALEDCAINDVPEVQKAYLAFIAADGAYRIAKVNWESAKRAYWDQKEALKFK